MSTLKVTNIKAADGTSALSIADGTGVVGANKFANLAGTGAPDFPNGLTLAGNTTGGSVTGVTLDDYEEGTWTPAISTTLTSPTGFAYTDRAGTYIKIGKQVSVVCYIIVDQISSAGTGTPTVTGLPFSPENIAGVTIGWWNALATKPSFAGYSPLASIEASVDYVQFVGGVWYTGTDDKYITFNATYKIS